MEVLDYFSVGLIRKHLPVARISNNRKTNYD